MKLHIIHNRAIQALEILEHLVPRSGNEVLVEIEHPDPVTATSMAKIAAACILVGRSCLDLRISNRPEEFQL